MVVILAVVHELVLPLSRIVLEQSKAVNVGNGYCCNLWLLVSLQLP